MSVMVDCLRNYLSFNLLRDIVIFLASLLPSAMGRFRNPLD